MLSLKKLYKALMFQTIAMNLFDKMDCCFVNEEEKICGRSNGKIFEGCIAR